MKGSFIYISQAATAPPCGGQEDHQRRAARDCAGNFITKDTVRLLWQPGRQGDDLFTGVKSRQRREKANQDSGSVFTQ